MSEPVIFVVRNWDNATQEELANQLKTCGCDGCKCGAAVELAVRMERRIERHGGIERPSALREAQAARRSILLP